MSDTIGRSNIEDSNSSLYEILKNCVNQQSYESLPSEEDYNDVCTPNNFDYHKMISTSTYSNSGNISSSSFASDESFGENILEDNGRISLAYENLRTIPRRIAEKFAAQTKFLDLSYNNFQNLSFLSFFEELHTLILDRNSRLDMNTLPFLPNLKILWINNCDISNVTDWVHRIQKQCPILEHLSIMGNPGIKIPFNFCTLASSHMPMDPLPPTSVVTDYREYILHVLAQLEYLDGVPRCVQSVQTATPSLNYRNGQLPSTSSSSSFSPAGNSKHLADQHKTLLNRERKNSPSLSFKDIFRLKRRKKSYQSSSTN